jgi:Amidohydrolase family
MAARGELSLRVLTTLCDGASSHRPEDGVAMAARIRKARPFDGDHWYDRVAVGEVYYAAFHWDHPGIAPSPTEQDIAGADEILVAAAEAGWPVQTHSVTTAGLDFVFDAYERADAKRPIRALRWSVTHAEGMTAAHVERTRRLGITVQLRSMGVIRAKPAVLVPLRQIADSGLSWGLGTDGTRAAQVNPFVTLFWAVTGRSLGGEQGQEEVLTREEALIAHTRGNAFLMFRENHLGSLRPGMLADLLVLDRDYLTVPAEEIKDIVPVATMVGGRIVHGSLALPTQLPVGPARAVSRALRLARGTHHTSARSGCSIRSVNAASHRAARAPSIARWSTDSVQRITVATRTSPSTATGCCFAAPTARMPDCGGLMIAENSCVPYMPRFDTEKTPPSISS